MHRKKLVCNLGKLAAYYGWKFEVSRKNLRFVYHYMDTLTGGQCAHFVWKSQISIWHLEIFHCSLYLCAVLNATAQRMLADRGLSLRPMQQTIDDEITRSPAPSQGVSEASIVHHHHHLLAYCHQNNNNPSMDSGDRHHHHHHCHRLSKHTFKPLHSQTESKTKKTN